MKRSEAEILMERHLREIFGDSPMIGAEVKFHPTRRWRFDFAIPEMMLGMEIEGGIWIRGHHSRGQGYQDDLEKYNTATAMGWTIFRFSTDDVKQGRDIEFLRAWQRRITPILEGA